MVIAVGCWKEKTQEMGRRYITAPPVSVFCFIQGTLCMHVCLWLVFNRALLYFTTEVIRCEMLQFFTDSFASLSSPTAFFLFYCFIPPLSYLPSPIVGSVYC